MTLRQKILITLVVFVVVGAGAAWVWLASHAVRVFDEAASSFTQRDIQVQAVQPVFPCGIVVKGFSMEGRFKAKAFRLDIDPWKIFRRQIGITSVLLDEPEFLWEEAKDEGRSVPSNVTSAGGGTPSRPLRVILKKVVVRDGTVRIKGREGQSIVVDQIQADLTNVPLAGGPGRVEFFATGSLVHLDVPFVGNFLKAKGWVNWPERGMEVQAQAVDDNGHVGLDVALTAAKNDLLVQGTARLSVNQQAQALGRRTGIVEDVVLGVLESTGSDIEARFSFRTKMDRPEVDQIQLAGNITTGLNSSDLSGNIVESLRGVAQEFLRSDARLKAE